MFLDVPTSETNRMFPSRRSHYFSPSLPASLSHWLKSWPMRLCFRGLHLCTVGSNSRGEPTLYIDSCSCSDLSSDFKQTCAPPTTEGAIALGPVRLPPEGRFKSRFDLEDKAQ